MLDKPIFQQLVALGIVIIGFLTLGNVLLDLKDIDGDYEKLFSIVGNVGSTLIGVGMFYLGWQQHQLRKLSEEEKKIIRENYDKFNAGISMLYNSYKNSDKINEAKEILRQASNHANLELPTDLKTYVQEAYNLSQQLSLEVRKQSPNNYDELHNKISERFLGYESYKRHSNYLIIHR